MADKLEFVAEAVRRHPMSYDESNFQKKKEKNLTWDDVAKVANYAASPPRWKPPWCGEGAYLTKRFQPVHQQGKLARANLLRLGRISGSSLVLCQEQDSVLKFVVTLALITWITKP